MGYAATFVRCGAAILLCAGFVSHLRADALSSPASIKIGPLAKQRIALATERSRVIVRIRPDVSPDDAATEFEQVGATLGPSLDIINARVVELPSAAIAALADNPMIEMISLDREVVPTMERTAATIGATAVRQGLGYDGTGVGVAIIDSGITSWHDDLANGSGGQRVVRFVDFVRNRPNPYDDYGHGTHVAGIIAGDGFDSAGARTGVAPGAQLTVLKVLDEQGNGRISDVIAAFDYVLKKSAALNIRVVNVSVATGVYESYLTDPLTLAAKRLVDAGIVVVAAAGNLGRTPRGSDAYGGITAPGNAPWVLTVGASSHVGTATRADDTMAVFSSRGPTAIDRVAKPDLVAPGVGIESLSNPDSAFYTTLSAYLLAGTVDRGYLPYLSLTGTSMAAPVVSGAIALMLQANPALTPNAIKAILQYTAQVYSGYDPLTEGAGFLDAAGAVRLAKFFANPSQPLSIEPSWSRRLIWGNQMIRGGVPTPDGTAWANGVTWGASTARSGTKVDWGVRCTDDACTATTSARWSVSCVNDACSAVNWGSVSRNIVWGMRCNGADCAEQWTMATAYDESVVWGTVSDESVVWGTAADESVVWGTTADESVVWGTSCGKTLCQPVVWPRP
jgi:serine protease AprX